MRMQNQDITERFYSFCESWSLLMMNLKRLMKTLRSKLKSCEAKDNEATKHEVRNNPQES